MRSSTILAESGYSGFARFFHWTVVVLMVAMFYTGFVGYGGAATQPWQKPLSQQWQSPTAAAPYAAFSRGAGPAPAWQRPNAGNQRRGQSPWSTNQLHKSLGLIVLALTAIRLAYRAARKYPPAPADMPRPMVFAARANQALLYLCLILQPVTGVTGSGKAFKFLGAVTIPSFASPAYIPLLHTLHIYVAYLLLLLILLHSSAALFHHYVRKDGVLRAMVTG